jgi:hypothetical protein
MSDLVLAELWRAADPSGGVVEWAAVLARLDLIRATHGDLASVSEVIEQLEVYAWSMYAPLAELHLELAMILDGVSGDG